MSDALHLLEQMRRRYASAETYRDEGRVEVWTRLGTGRREVVTATFRTDFARASGLSFGYRSMDGARFEVRVEGGDWSGAKRAALLAHAVARATGVTFGAAQMVPRLLLPEEVPGRDMTAVERAGVNGRESVDGEPCVVIALEGGAQVFVDESTLSLRRVVHDIYGAGAMAAEVVQRTTGESVGELEASRMVTYAPRW